jgi:hypothetical protein
VVAGQYKLQSKAPVAASPMQPSPAPQVAR